MSHSLRQLGCVPDRRRSAAMALFLIWRVERRVFRRLQVLVLNHPLVEMVERLRVAAAGAGIDCVRMLFTPVDAQPRWQAEIVMRFLGPQHLKLLVFPNQPLKIAARNDMCSRKLLLKRGPCTWAHPMGTLGLPFLLARHRN